METDLEPFFALIEALGIGLLIGIERERSTQNTGNDPSAGVRTFALASLIGAISMIGGGVPLLIVAIATVAALRAVLVVQQGDFNIGMTTSLALIAVVLLGAIATETALLAAGLGVVIASLLAARDALRGFSREILTAAELRGGLILGVAILVILPVLPNLAIGPGGALNPRSLFVIIVVVMLIGTAGHIATRVVGPRFGLPISGFLSGFASSTATIAVLGRRAGENPGDANSAATGATLSSLSSLAQIAIILLIVSPAMFNAGLPMLLGIGLVAGLHGMVSLFFALKDDAARVPWELPSQIFSVRNSVGFALIVAMVMLVSATFNDFLGGAGILATVALAGLVSTNSAAVALASLVAAEQIQAVDGILPLAAALTANTFVRMGVALRSPERSFRITVAGGLVVQLSALWFAWWLSDDAPLWVVDLLRLVRL